MAHTIYQNFVLANRIEDLYNSYLDLATFCTVDNSLVGTPGMVKKINVYTATSGTEALEMGVGNSKDIEVGYTQKDYTIKMAQNRFKYFDEQEMTDPLVVETGLRHMATDMFNYVNDGIFAEFNNATLTHEAATPDFAAFVDGVSKLNVKAQENLPGMGLFGIVSMADMAKIRKALKDDLKYVEASAVKQGYVGTVAGVTLFAKADAPAGTIIIANREAVTLFNKKGVEVEQDRDGDIRQNTIWSRKYFLPALTDTTKVVKITIGG